MTTALIRADRALQAFRRLRDLAQDLGALAPPEFMADRYGPSWEAPTHMEEDLDLVERILEEAVTHHRIIEALR